MDFQRLKFFEIQVSKKFEVYLYFWYDEYYFAKTRRRVKDQGQKLTDPLSSNQQQIDLKIPFINMLSIYN